MAFAERAKKKKKKERHRAMLGFFHDQEECHPEPGFRRVIWSNLSINIQIVHCPFATWHAMVKKKYSFTYIALKDLLLIIVKMIFVTYSK